MMIQSEVDPFARKNIWLLLAFDGIALSAALIGLVFLYGAIPRFADLLLVLDGYLAVQFAWMLHHHYSLSSVWADDQGIHYFHYRWRTLVWDALRLIERREHRLVLHSFEYSVPCPLYLYGGFDEIVRYVRARSPRARYKIKRKRV